MALSGKNSREKAVAQTLLLFICTVTAASMWGGPAEHKRVCPALPDSYEALFHDLGLPRFLLGLDEESDALRALCQPHNEGNRSWRKILFAA
jgi:erythromycin esterase-like protein